MMEAWSVDPIFDHVKTSGSTVIKPLEDIWHGARICQFQNLDSNTVSSLAHLRNGGV